MFNHLVVRTVENVPAFSEIHVPCLGWKDASIHSSIQGYTPVSLPGESMDGGAWRATVHEVANSQT